MVAPKSYLQIKRQPDVLFRCCCICSQDDCRAHAHGAHVNLHTRVHNRPPHMSAKRACRCLLQSILLMTRADTVVKPTVQCSQGALRRKAIVQCMCLQLHLLACTIDQIWIRWAAVIEDGPESKTRCFVSRVPGYARVFGGGFVDEWMSGLNG